MKAKNLGPGKHADGQGLWLIKKEKISGKWIVRIVIQGKRREMGLGRWPDVSIAEARERASEARQHVRDGMDPIAERQEQSKKPLSLTVEEAVHGCFEARQAELKHDGKAGRWLSPLKTHILPKIGSKPIESIDQHAIKDVLDPIWHSKADTARKALNRLNLTLSHAAALGLEVDLQAPMEARALMGKQRHEVTNIPSMPYQEVPKFYKWLSGQELIAAKALQFLILTAARTSEVRLATFDEITEGVWRLPAERTKTGAPHRIPLSKAAQNLIATMPHMKDCPYIFASNRGKPLSDMAMSTLMKREGYTARPHGFRASFRTWADEQSDYPFEVKEMALGHKVGSNTVRAYQRSDQLEARISLMEDWQNSILVI
ncbi:tyrosine-type recombinase/integrase [Yoonia sp. I 8.24]|nr:site-specific integrase [Yoonia sp. I 8.24]MCG3269024.1 tyrosine-type recombinase/integrase [Yoonia sp. I 8.24]